MFVPCGQRPDFGTQLCSSAVLCPAYPFVVTEVLTVLLYVLGCLEPVARAELVRFHA